jgi:hypothetical protein
MGYRFRLVIYGSIDRDPDSKEIFYGSATLLTFDYVVDS